jgi:hypothetical protein
VKNENIFNAKAQGIAKDAKEDHPFVASPAVGRSPDARRPLLTVNGFSLRSLRTFAPLR